MTTLNHGIPQSDSTAMLRIHTSSTIHLLMIEPKNTTLARCPGECHSHWLLASTTWCTHHNAGVLCGESKSRFTCQHWPSHSSILFRFPVTPLGNYKKPIIIWRPQTFPLPFLNGNEPTLKTELLQNHWALQSHNFPWSTGCYGCMPPISQSKLQPQHWKKHEDVLWKLPTGKSSNSHQVHR